MSEFPDLHILFTTVGESTSLSALEALKTNTRQPYKLTVWYDACGRDVDWSFYDVLLKYTDDVVLLTQNHGISMALGLTMLYSNAKYLLHVLADTVVLDGYLDKFAYAFSRFDKVACAGCVRVDDYPEFDSKYDFIVNSEYFMPDGVTMYSRAAINDIGGIASAFEGYGFQQKEWLDRAKSKGWTLISCKNIMKETGTTHEGRSMNKNLDAEIKKSTQTYLKIRGNRYNDFNWWDNSWKEKREIVNA